MRSYSAWVPMNLTQAIPARYCISTTSRYLLRLCEASHSRKNYLFCGSEGGGRRAALMYSLIESAKLNGINPQAYLLDVLTRLPTAKRDDLDALMPWNIGA